MISVRYTYSRPGQLGTGWTEVEKGSEEDQKFLLDAQAHRILIRETEEIEWSGVYSF